MSFLEALRNIALPNPETLEKGLRTLTDGHAVLFSYAFLSVRILSALLAVLIVSRCIRSLMQGKIEPETWAYLDLPDGERFPVRHWENVIGRARAADLRIEVPTVSRSHAALIRGEDGSWTLTDLGSKSGTLLNGAAIAEPSPLSFGDTISVGGIESVFTLPSPEERVELAAARTKPGRVIRPSRTLLQLTLFQLLLAAQLTWSLQFTWSILLPFGVLLLAEWITYAFFRILRRTGFEIETLCFFLTTLGFSVAASSSTEAPVKQVAALLIGLFLFLSISWFLRDLKRATTLRWAMAAAALAVLAVNFVFGETIYGARNWLSIGGYTFQPSEFVKVAFVYAGGATLDRLFAKRNVYLFIAFTGACVGALALMGDFGTAAIFFAAFLVIVYLRSGDLFTIALVCAAVVLGAIVVLSIKPYIMNRFAVWGHVWEYAHAGGYQQTRTMSAAASGGLFGFGAGSGWLKKIAAADTDLVFGMLCEELGLGIALAGIAAVTAPAVFSVRSAAAGRSSFYVICACAASSMLVFQMMLNVFGSVDLLPLTGVTFPFVSNGGSSLAACWGMMAFIKAADTRQNASIAVKLQKRIRLPRPSRDQAQEEEAAE